MDRSTQMRNAVLFALTTLAATLVVIKMMTGLAFAPLAVIGIFVFVFSFGVKMRIERGSGAVVRADARRDRS